MRKWDSKKSNVSDDPVVAELQERRRRAIAEMPYHSDKVQ
jgi:hypothetical protein